MTLQETLEKYNISNATLRNWKKLNYIDDLNNIDSEIINDILKSKKSDRRNKKNSVDKIIPTSYINDKNIIDIIKNILKLKDIYKITIKSHTIQILIESILKILYTNNLEIPNELWNILGERTNNMEFIDEFSKIEIKYEADNDFLGCLYMSLLSIGKKDVNGIFYTPFTVVNQIVESIDFNNTHRILDPGCGSGNFLIQIYKRMKEYNILTEDIIENLYGFDVDNIAVLLAKINIYILDDSIDFDSIKIYNKDFLVDEYNINFDIILGNPPWGKKYTIKEKNKLKEIYGLQFSKMDSFSQFIIKSLEKLNECGILEFVLPSSILNIAVHENIRKLLLNYKIEFIREIGREFEEIVTDVVIIKVIKRIPLKDETCLYNDKQINQQYFRNNTYTNFLITDTISTNIIRKIESYNHFHLIRNVNYALGIVTGNNKEYLSSIKTDENEPIISGKEIDKYNMDYTKISKYIKFERNKFQQVASEDLYRCKNKIIYKFIGKKLSFAVEQNGILTLNSANIICLGNEYDIFYISAILNSRITQLYFEDSYNTHKVLKNHIQSFCIPNFTNDVRETISNLAQNIGPYLHYCEDIENIIYEELGLTEEEIKYIKNRF